MRLPIFDFGSEDRAEHVVFLHARIEATYEAFDHRLVDPGLGLDLRGDRRAAFLSCAEFFAHRQTSIKTVNFEYIMSSIPRQKDYG
jgi:hypothetical protein